MQYYIGALKKYATFAGRASRKEFWMFLLINVLIIVGIAVLAALVQGSETLYNIVSIVYLLYIVAMILPSISVVVRRLHDTGRSGWWYFIQLVPFVGSIVMFVFLVLGSTPGNNKYGAGPSMPQKV